MMSRAMRIGTRESALAMYQTRLVAARLEPAAIDIVGITTAGDNTSVPLTGQGTSGLFVNALRSALLDGRVDLIVHSLKDVPTVPDARVTIGAVPERIDVRDVFVGRDGRAIADLAAGSRVGTSSPRRAAWVRRRRPDLRVDAIRGNVDTRLAKVQRGEYEGTLLAAAGLLRLGLLTDAMQPLEVDDLIPAPAQGALAVECRADDAAALAVLAAIDDEQARLTTTAERAVLRELGATCATAAGAIATLARGVLTLRADVMSTQTLERIHVEMARPVHDAMEADAVGADVARQLLEAGAGALVEMP